MLNSDHDQAPSVSIGEFVERCPAELGLQVLAGSDALSARFINSARIQKLGLALAGFAHYIHAGRVQIVGQSEILYLEQIDSDRRREALENLSFDDISCILITKGLKPPDELLAVADERGVPVLKSTLLSSAAIEAVSKSLLQILAPSVTIHGVLLGMYGIGVLLRGASGVGKSECALDLIMRGHRLISDDAVLIKRIGDGLEGSSPELIHGFLEIRGLGIVNIRELFGVSVIGKSKDIEVCVELRPWNEMGEIDRLGLESHEEVILGVSVPKFILPVSPGRTLATLVETAVRIHLLQEVGTDSAQSLIERHGAMLRGGEE